MTTAVYRALNSRMTTVSLFTKLISRSLCCFSCIKHRFVSMEPNKLKMASHEQRNEYMRTNRMLDELGSGDRMVFKNNKPSRMNSKSQKSKGLGLKLLTFS